jgi:anaerobic magnesium-protoporphyrin IX monomethyl ester cyclase
MIASTSLVRRPPAIAFERVAMCIPPSLFLLDERVFPALGILRVAAVLEKAGVKIDMLDLSGIANYEEVVETYVRDAAPSVLCLTATTPQMPAAKKIVETIRALKPDVRFVLGGPHITLVHAAARLEKKAGRVARGHAALAKLEALFDVLVAGDGEEAIFIALSATPPKLVDADDPHGPLFMTSAFYNETPWPARHLLDIESYVYTVDGQRAGNLILQLGCSMKCVFCGGRSSPMLRRIRTRTADAAIAEIEHLYRTYNFTAAMLHDDELNINKSVVPLMNAIDGLQKRLGISFRFRGFIKAELFTEEQAEAMHRAGFRWLLCGFEAAHPRILENIQKNATVEDNARVVDICHRFGLKVKALMSVGHAGETRESILAVRDWLIDVKPDDFDCTVISTYPGTPYYDEALPHSSLKDVWTYTCKKSGDRLHAYDIDYMEVADYYKGDPEGGYRSYVFTDHLSAEEIVSLRDEVERDVRAKLNIPFNPGAPGIRYEHSMGANGGLPPLILRTSGVGQ